MEEKKKWKRIESVEECVKIEKSSLDFYLEEQKQELLTAVVLEGVISDDENLEDVKIQLM